MSVGQAIKRFPSIARFAGVGRGKTVSMADSRVMDDAELRRDLEDGTEDTLYALYDEVSPVLAATFDELKRAADRELEVLTRLAELLSLEAAPEDTSEAAVDRIAWQPVARSSVLFLFTWLAAHSPVNETCDWSPIQWARQTKAALDTELFTAQTGLPAGDIDLALRLSARAITESSVLQHWEFLVFEGTPMLVSATGASISVTTLDELPIGYMELGGGQVVGPSHQEVRVPAGGASFFSALDRGALVRDGETTRLGVLKTEQLLVVDLRIDGPFDHDYDGSVLQIQPSSSEERVAIHFGSGVRAIPAASGLVLQTTVPGD